MMRPILSFENVARNFRKRKALQNFTLECAMGSVTCLIGANGAGKSTALALAAGLLATSSGRVFIADREVKLTSVCRKVGYLPQHSAFPATLTAGEVFAFAVSARRSDERARAEIVHVTGLEQILEQAVGELSGGWVRRLGLAVSLLRQTDVLLLDEPFVGLDPDTLDRVVQHIAERAAAGAAVLLASHEFEIADLLSPRVAVLDEGILLGTFAAEIPSTRAIYRQILNERANQRIRVVEAGKERMEA